MTQSAKSNDIILSALGEALGELEKAFSSNVFFIRSPIVIGLDDAIRDEIEDISRLENKSKRLTVVLETPGGYIEVVERIHKVFRHHFELVDFVVPNFSYSAGTVLALSGDEIYMDYYSVLGPIDPQVPSRDGRMVPALGYLQKYQELIDKSLPGADDPITDAEIEYLVRKFDPAELFALEQAVEHSKSLIREWLPRYKFKDWETRENTGEKVTEEHKRARADEIASTLGNAKRWKSHGRGIFLKDLDSEEIKLKVKNLGENPSLRQSVMQYYELFTDFCANVGCQKTLHSKNGLRALGD